MKIIISLVVIFLILIHCISLIDLIDAENNNDTNDMVVACVLDQLNGRITSLVDCDDFVLYQLDGDISHLCADSSFCNKILSDLGKVKK